MKRRHVSLLSAGLLIVVLAAAGLAEALAAKLTLKDGRELDGSIAQLSSMADNPNTVKAKEGQVQSIVFTDDNLRRTFVPKRRIQEANQSALGDSEEKIYLRQPVPRLGAVVGSVGPLAQVTRFDEFGRRRVAMATIAGLVPIVQGITELTPHWAKVEALQIEGRALKWDMRISTSSVPLDELDKVLTKLTDPKKLDQRLRVVRFYNQCERYKEAEEKLKAVVRDFPENKDQFGPVVTRLHQGYARRILAELRTRREAGQHGLVLAKLKEFPTEDVAGETLQSVRQMLDQYQADFQRGTQLLEKLKAEVGKIKESLYKAQLAQILEEITRELNLNTLDRLAAFGQFCDDETLTPEDKVALAASGWVAGTPEATRKLPVAVSLFEIRNLTRSYLTETMKFKHEELLGKIRTREGASPQMIAKVLAHMKPPLEPGEPMKGKPGLYQHEVEVFSGVPATNYFVQLPPEYDPHRQYPTIVTLHGSGSTAEQQIDWWAGPLAADGSRLGQATRHGYIVVAPDWSKAHQKTYGYTGEEHGAVLNSLRDACRRFSIDTDRVFLSGHSMGGDAAWDIGLAHPDLWAGMIPIAAVADRYVAHYWENAAYVPFYLVDGGLDSDNQVRNARDLDRYFTHGYNVTVVEYEGRGHEHFYDEILRLFDWMGRYHRNFFPRDFTCHSMREWDNFFWWVELHDLPEKAVVDPQNWPPPRGIRAGTTEATINEKNGLNVRTSAASATVWLAPEMVSFDQPIRVMVNGTKVKPGDTSLDPDIQVLLEDARTRADRRHVFWARVDLPLGRVNVAER
ncbi:MAG TPA: peptidase [Pirellulales bacterium]|nr:peptidase [Pirellulales bacterium]